MNEICIIIQGPTNSLNLYKIKQIYKNTNIHLLFSTWKGCEDKYDKNDICIFNELPQIKGTQNIMLQQCSTYNGLLKAKELGFERAIKIRSDMYFENINKFLQLDLNYNKINFLYFLDYYRKGCRNEHYKYFCDYIQISSIDNLLKMWDFKYKQCYYAEELITKHIFNTFKTEEIAFVGKYLTKENDIYWIKKKLHLSTIKSRNYKMKIS